MLGVEVSGRQKKRSRNTGPEIQRISQSDQRQFSAGTLKPETMGPRAGPQVAAATQKVRR